MARFKRKFKKKPIIVKAHRWGGKHDPESGGRDLEGMAYCWLLTEYGNLKCIEGDWIIEEEGHGIYPCKQEMFFRTFEPVDDPDDPDETQIIYPK